MYVDIIWRQGVREVQSMDFNACYAHVMYSGGVQRVEANGMGFWGYRSTVMLNLLSLLVRFVRKMIINMIAHRLEFKIATKVNFFLYLYCHVELISCILVQCVIDAGAVEGLVLLISEPKSTRDIVKEACWTLSNIAAGSLSQISAVLESGCVEHVVMLANDVRDRTVSISA